MPDWNIWCTEIVDANDKLAKQRMSGCAPSAGLNWIWLKTKFFFCCSVWLAMTGQNLSGPHTLLWFSDLQQSGFGSTLSCARQQHAHSQAGQHVLDFVGATQRNLDLYYQCIARKFVCVFGFLFVSVTASQLQFPLPLLFCGILSNEKSTDLFLECGSECKAWRSPNVASRSSKM